MSSRPLTLRYRRRGYTRCKLQLQRLRHLNVAIADSAKPVFGGLQYT